MTAQAPIDAPNPCLLVCDSDALSARKACPRSIGKTKGGEFLANDNANQSMGRQNKEGRNSTLCGILFCQAEEINSLRKLLSNLLKFVCHPYLKEGMLVEVINGPPVIFMFARQPNWSRVIQKRVMLCP